MASDFIGLAKRLRLFVILLVFVSLVVCWLQIRRADRLRYVEFKVWPMRFGTDMETVILRMEDQQTLSDLQSWRSAVRLEVVTERLRDCLSWLCPGARPSFCHPDVCHSQWLTLVFEDGHEESLYFVGLPDKRGEVCTICTYGRGRALHLDYDSPFWEANQNERRHYDAFLKDVRLDRGSHPFQRPARADSASQTEPDRRGPQSRTRSGQ
jgi:hypothetical protein